MVRIATGLILLASALTAQACTYCQCLFSNGDHCCVYSVSLSASSIYSVSVLGLVLSALPSCRGRQALQAFAKAGRDAALCHLPLLSHPKRLACITRVTSTTANMEVHRRTPRWATWTARPSALAPTAPTAQRAPTASPAPPVPPAAVTSAPPSLRPKTALPATSSRGHACGIGKL
jgi:hypothetical protein